MEACRFASTQGVEHTSQETGAAAPCTPSRVEIDECLASSTTGVVVDRTGAPLLRLRVAGKVSKLRARVVHVVREAVPEKLSFLGVLPPALMAEADTPHELRVIPLIAVPTRAL